MLAGGLGSRIGGDKAVVSLGGRPLVSYALGALREALGPTGPVAVVAKRDTLLPALPAGVAVWIEPDEPRHPLTGIVCALERAGGRDVLVLAVDLPLVTAGVLRGLLDAAAAPVMAARAGGRAQPLCALYAASSLPLLRAAPPGWRLNDIIAELGAVAVDVGDANALLNVNTLQDAQRAEALLAARGCRRQCE